MFHNVYFACVSPFVAYKTRHEKKKMYFVSSLSYENTNDAI